MSHGATELRALRAAGWAPSDVWERLLPLLGMAAFDPAAFRPGTIRAGPVGYDAAP